MVQSLKAGVASGPAKTERVLLFPGTAAAEPWQVWFVAEGRTTCTGGYARAADNPWRRSSTLILPAAEVLCLPLWIEETDEKQLRSAIPLQLEMQGVHFRDKVAPTFDFQVADREGQRTLVVVAVLPAMVERGGEYNAYRRFDVSARCLPLPEGSMTLWRERGKLVCAITRGEHLVYFQSTGEEHVNPRLVQSLQSVLVALGLRRVIESVGQVMVWAEISDEEKRVLATGLQSPVAGAEMPPPRLPPSSWTLVPESVLREERRRKARRLRWRIGVAVAAGYLVLIGMVVTNIVTLSLQAGQLQRWKTAHAAPLALVTAASSDWKDLQPLVDEQDYPLEILLRVADAMPADQLHLTLFEMGDGHLLIKGEAKNVAAAYSFLDELKKDAVLAGTSLSMAQPHLLPNDLAQFQIEGSISGPPPQ